MDSIVLEYLERGVKLIRQNARLGKSAGLNVALAQARGELVVFSDANAIYEPDVIGKFARHFSDPCIGYVVGNARYAKHERDSQSADAEGLYWKYETWLKRQESDLSQLWVVTALSTQSGASCIPPYGPRTLTIFSTRSRLLIEDIGVSSILTSFATNRQLTLLHRSSAAKLVLSAAL